MSYVCKRHLVPNRWIKVTCLLGYLMQLSVKMLSKTNIILGWMEVDRISNVSVCLWLILFLWYARVLPNFVCEVHAILFFAKKNL